MEYPSVVNISILETVPKKDIHQLISEGTITTLISKPGKETSIDNNINRDEACNISQVPTNWDKNTNIFYGYHHYFVDNEIGSISMKRCTVDEVFNLMISQAGYLAPTDNNNPIHNCSKTVVHIPFLGDGTIVTFVNYKVHQILNYTLQDHPLFPGAVKRTIVQKGNLIHVLTEGEGRGKLPRLNEYKAKSLWGEVDQKLRNAVYRSSIIK